MSISQAVINAIRENWNLKYSAAFVTCSLVNKSSNTFLGMRTIPLFFKHYPFLSTSCLSETHAKRQATRHDCLPSLLGDRDNGIEIVYVMKKIFCTGPTREAKAGQKSLIPARQTQRTRQGRTLSFVLFKSPTPQYNLIN